MKNDWWTDLAKKMQMYADLGDTRSFFETLKALHGPSHQIQAPLRSADGSTLLTDKDAIMHRWSGHFSSLFSDKRKVEESSLLRIPQAEVKTELNDLLTLEEVKKAVLFADDCALLAHTQKALQYIVNRFAKLQRRLVLPLA